MPPQRMMNPRTARPRGRRSAVSWRDQPAHARAGICVDAQIHVCSPAHPAARVCEGGEWHEAQRAHVDMYVRERWGERQTDRENRLYGMHACTRARRNLLSVGNVKRALFSDSSAPYASTVIYDGASTSAGGKGAFILFEGKKEKAAFVCCRWPKHGIRGRCCSPRSWLCFLFHKRWRGCRAGL